MEKINNNEAGYLDKPFETTETQLECDPSHKVVLFFAEDVGHVLYGKTLEEIHNEAIKRGLSQFSSNNKIVLDELRRMSEEMTDFELIYVPTLEGKHLKFRRGELLDATNDPRHEKEAMAEDWFPAYDKHIG